MNNPGICYVVYVDGGYYEDKYSAIVYVGLSNEKANQKILEISLPKQRFAYLETWVDGELCKVEEFEL